MTTNRGEPVEPPPRRRVLRSDAARNHRLVLDAARQAYAEEGLGVGFDVIARRAGVGVGTVYRRFPDRAALLEALFEDRFDVVREVAERFLTADDAWSGFEAFVVESARMFAEDRGLREITFDPTPKYEAVTRQRQRLVPLLDDVVSRAQAAGVLRPDCRTSDLARIIAMLSDVTIRGDDETAEDVESAAARVQRFVLEGIRRGGGSAGSR